MDVNNNNASSPPHLSSPETADKPMSAPKLTRSMSAPSPRQRGTVRNSKSSSSPSSAAAAAAAASSPMTTNNENNNDNRATTAAAAAAMTVTVTPGSENKTKTPSRLGLAGRMKKASKRATAATAAAASDDGDDDTDAVADALAILSGGKTTNKKNNQQPQQQQQQEEEVAGWRQQQQQQQQQQHHQSFCARPAQVFVPAHTAVAPSFHHHHAVSGDVDSFAAAPPATGSGHAHGGHGPSPMSLARSHSVPTTTTNSPGPSSYKTPAPPTRRVIFSDHQQPTEMMMETGTMETADAERGGDAATLGKRKNSPVAEKEFHAESAKDVDGSGADGGFSHGMYDVEELLRASEASVALGRWRAARAVEAAENRAAKREAELVTLLRHTAGEFDAETSRLQTQLDDARRHAEQLKAGLRAADEEIADLTEALGAAARTNASNAWRMVARAGVEKRRAADSRAKLRRVVADHHHHAAAAAAAAAEASSSSLVTRYEDATARAAAAVTAAEEEEARLAREDDEDREYETTAAVEATNATRARLVAEMAPSVRDELRTSLAGKVRVDLKRELAAEAEAVY